MSPADSVDPGAYERGPLAPGSFAAVAREMRLRARYQRAIVADYPWRFSNSEALRRAGAAEAWDSAAAMVERQVERTRKGLRCPE